MARALLSARPVLSAHHEIPIALFRMEPRFLVQVLRELCGAELPAEMSAKVLESDFTEVVPAAWQADLVVELRAHHARGQRPDTRRSGRPAMRQEVRQELDMQICQETRNTVGTLCVVVEVQRAVDRRKRFSWPLYVYALAARRKTRACLLVLAETEQVARWARRPIHTVPGSSFAPLVLGPKDIPYVRTAEEARRAPELALLSVMAHETEPGGEAIVRAACEGIGALDEERRQRYSDWLMATSAVARLLLEETMKGWTYEYPMSDFAKEHYGRGKTEGRVEGEALSILAVLQARGFVVDDVLQQRILQTTDLARLERLLVLAARCSSIEEFRAGAALDP